MSEDEKAAAGFGIAFRAIRCVERGRAVVPSISAAKVALEGMRELDAELGPEIDAAHAALDEALAAVDRACATAQAKFEVGLAEVYPEHDAFGGF